MLVFPSRSALMAMLLATMGAWPSANAALIVSVDDIDVDLDGRGTVEVFVENLNPGVASFLDNFTLTIDLLKTGGIGSGQLLVIANDTPELVRNGDARHVLEGTIPLFFNSRTLNAGQSIEVIDSVGLLDFPSPVSSRRLLTAFDIEADPTNPLIGHETFQVSIDASESAFFDAPFSQITAGDLVFQSGTISINDAPVGIPEPGSIWLIGAVACAIAACSSRGRRPATLSTPTPVPAKRESPGEISRPIPAEHARRGACQGL
ncbi:MAG: hypothetical protein AAF670_19985 [Planctomycetota bacterium]